MNGFSFIWWMIGAVYVYLVLIALVRRRRNTLLGLLAFPVGLLLFFGPR